MKTTITLSRKLGLMVLLVLLANFVRAEDYYTFKGVATTINPETSTYAGYKWILIAAPATIPLNVAINTVESTPTLSYNFPIAGSYTLRLSVLNAVGGCWSDDTDKDITIFSLPPFTIEVTPAITSYCENAIPTDNIDLTAAATIEDGLAVPISILLAEWHQTLAADGNLTGSIAGPTTGAVYGIKPTTAGDYYYVAIGKYDIPANKLISVAGTPVKSATAKLTVTEKPSTPTITPVIITP